VLEPTLSVETVTTSAPGGAAEPSEWAVLRVAGELDAATGPVLRSRLVELVDEGVRHIVLDLGDVPFLDSSGLGVLVTGLKRLRIAGGTLRLAGCRPPVRAVLKITSLDRVFFLYPSVDAALADTTEYLPPSIA
jgi:anti-sigma B factor antagonist